MVAGGCTTRNLVIRHLNVGWQIGSGPTEAQCKLTVGRLKGRSRRWDRPNAAAVAALDSLEPSGQWSKYWTTPCSTSV